MTTSDKERPRFYEQQYLGADDLAAIVEYTRAARARHDIGGHTWGIAAGLQLAERTGATGNLEMYVHPGFAWDGFGRSLLVPSPYKISADLFRSLTYNASLDNTATPGRLVDVWLQYTEAPAGSVATGFDVCNTDEQYARIAESFRVLIGARPAPADWRDPVNIGGRVVDAEWAYQAWGSAEDPLIPDASVPFQTFSTNLATAVWLVPLGVVRWLPSTTPAAGQFMARTEEDLKESERKRIYAGVNAETINGPRGVVRIRNRDNPLEPEKRSDDLLWCEGSARMDADVTMAGGKLILNDSNNSDNDAPFSIWRLGENALPQPGQDIVVQIGKEATARNRFTVCTVQEGMYPREHFTVRDNGTVGIGTGLPRAQLHVMAEKDATATLTHNHITYLQNTSNGANASVLALGVRTVEPAAGNNFITFFSGDFPVGAIQGSGSGVSLTSGGADYAEWLQRLNVDDTFEPGDIVGVIAGRITHRTDGADHLLVISTTPIVLGNRPAPDMQHLYESVAMLGQVTAKVRGVVRPGDIILASGRHDGTGIAVAPEQITFEQYPRAVGIAWETKTAGHVQPVRMALGLPMNRVWGALSSELEGLRAEVRARGAASLAVAG